MKIESIKKSEKLAMDVPEMCKLLGISKSIGYELAKSEGFPAICLGRRRIIIPTEGLLQWLSEKPMQKGGIN